MADTKKRPAYQALLSLDENNTVKNQFGWLPVSVYKPGHAAAWKDIIGDEGDQTTRRSAESKYLPGLRFSQFHPDLAEIVVRYWSLPGDLVCDPFAGRATRGIVALTLERRYLGFEVAPSTFSQTAAKIEALGGRLVNADGCRMADALDCSADLVFSCPPYFNIEKYESAPGQLSDLPTYEAFVARMGVAAQNAARVLKPGKFLCWVVGDFRTGGSLRVFHADTIRMFEAAGLNTHDIVIIHNNSPFAPLQAGKVAAKRYTAKVHEYLLVFRKPESKAS